MCLENSGPKSGGWKRKPRIKNYNDSGLHHHQIPVLKMTTFFSTWTRNFPGSKFWSRRFRCSNSLVKKTHFRHPWSTWWTRRGWILVQDDLGGQGMTGPRLFGGGILAVPLNSWFGWQGGRGFRMLAGCGCGMTCTWQWVQSSCVFVTWDSWISSFLGVYYTR